MTIDRGQADGVSAAAKFRVNVLGSAELTAFFEDTADRLALPGRMASSVPVEAPAPGPPRSVSLIAHRVWPATLAGVIVTPVRTSADRRDRFLLPTIRATR